MYLVEMVQTNRIVKERGRSEDYDKANGLFRRLKSCSCKELRLLRLDEGVRVLLKYVIKGRAR